MELLIGFAAAVIVAILIAISMLRKPRGRSRGRRDSASIAPRIDRKKFYRETIGEEAYKEEKAFDRQIARNNRARGLESQGEIEEAVKIYEELLAEGFPVGAGERLAVIYRKKKQYRDEIRVLERDIEILAKGSAWNPPIEKRKLRLEKARALAAKHNPT